MKPSRVTVALVALIAGCIAVDIGVLRHATPALVDAEERGVSVDLSYQPGHSTWGPTNVYGTAVLWPREGVATLTVHLLPRLDRGDRYVWWVLNARSGATKRLGTFNTSAAGDVFLDTFLAGSLPRGANAILVSIAHRGDPLAAPGASRTLYGNMITQSHPLQVPPALQAAQGLDRPAAPQPGTDGTGLNRSPAALPVTGGGPFPRARQQRASKKEG